MPRAARIEGKLHSFSGRWGSKGITFFFNILYLTTHLCSFLKNFFIGVKLLHSVVLVSAMQHSESATCLHRSPFWISVHFRSPKSTEFPVQSSRFSLAIYFIHSTHPSSYHIFFFYTSHISLSSTLQAPHPQVEVLIRGRGGVKGEEAERIRGEPCGETDSKHGTEKEGSLSSKALIQIHSLFCSRKECHIVSPTC